MDITFLGGAEKVGSLGMVLNNRGTNLLFDYGITPSKPPSYPIPAPSVEAAFLTHSHVDHSGMMPWLCGHKDVMVYTTSLTAEIALLLARDSNKICGLEGYPILYDEEDIIKTEKNFRNMKYGKIKRIGDIDVITHPAGHIPGAAMFEIHGERKCLFTGDINTTDTGLVCGTKGVKCDVLFLESTYAGREHDPRSKVEYGLLSKIEEVVDRGGKVVLPSFAVGRTQELMLLLRKTGYEVWVDGMGKSILDIYLRHEGFLRDPKKLKKAKSEVNIVKNHRVRKRALDGDVIITTSGMLDGGPALYYLDTLIENPKNALILTGYQVEGTNGRMLMEHGALEIEEKKRKPKCEVDFFDLSAHSGHSELVNFARSCNPEQIVLMHGDNREKLAEDLSDMNVLMPEKGKRYTI